jgi:hypothetical protein
MMAPLYTLGNMFWAGRYGSVVENLPSMCEALGLIASMRERRRRRRRREGGREGGKEKRKGNVLRGEVI